VAAWQARHAGAIADVTRQLLPAPVETPPAPMPVGPAEPPEERPAEAVVRVTAESLTRLMSLAGESLVQARWLGPFATALLKLKKHQDHLAGLLDSLVGRLPNEPLLDEARAQAATCRNVLGRARPRVRRPRRPRGGLERPAVPRGDRQPDAGRSATPPAGSRGSCAT